MAQVVAIDWSGRRDGASEAIWLARVSAGELVELENGWSRDGVIGRVVEIAEAHDRVVVGLDFAFSFPRWYCEQRGWARGDQVWEAMDEEEVERILESSPEPFWGGAGSTRQTVGEPLRETDVAPAKSIFQIGGAGAVGTGSLRGMRHLLTLRKAGFAVWPFHDPGARVAVEIYPRELTVGRVVKSRHRERRAHMTERFPRVDPAMRERAAGSEDAFDAAVSALRMSEHLADLGRLRAAPAGDVRRLEGAVWRPPAGAPGSD